MWRHVQVLVAASVVAGCAAASWNQDATTERPGEPGRVQSSGAGFVRRDYMPWVRRTSWQPRFQTEARSYADSSAFRTGADATLSHTPGTTFFSSPIPIVLASDNLLLTVVARLDGGRLGVEWQQARRAKFHPVLWVTPDSQGLVRLERVPAIRTCASFRLVVEAGPTGSSALHVVDCYGESLPRLKVLVNQVGYNVGQPKRFLVEANDPDLIGRPDLTASFRVVAPIGESGNLWPPNPAKEFLTVHEAPLVASGSVPEWGRSYWRGEFTALDEPNNYYIEATVGELVAESPVFVIDTNCLARRTLDPAHRFFWYQRCGVAVPGWHEACHLDDRLVGDDGRERSVAGGWHDAGDYNKYNGFTPLATYSLLYAAERHPEHHATQRRGRHIDILDEALWGAEFLRKMHEPVTGKLWGQVFVGYGYWGAPERQTDNLFGNQDDRLARDSTRSFFLVAAFAHVGRVLGERDYVDRALSHWRIAFDAENFSLISAAHAFFAAMELERATGDSQFAEIEATCVRFVIGCQSSDTRYDGWFASVPGGPPHYNLIESGLPAAAVAYWLREHPHHTMAQDAERALVRYLAFLTALADNPIGVSRCYDGKRLAYFRPYEKRGDWHVGQNSQYLSEAWAAFLIYQVTGREAALRFGLDQVNWVLGANPYGLCMLQGQGHANPASAHHGYSAIPGHPEGAPPGTVFNGITRFGPDDDLPLWDLVEQGIARFETNEPWLPHNAYYLLALTELAAICR